MSDLDAWVVLAPFTVRPARGLGLKLYAGPGFESKVPDFVREDGRWAKAFVSGIAIGVGF